MNPSLVPAIAMISVGAVVALVLHLAQQLSRPDVYFGITVDARFRQKPAGLAALRTYRVRLWTHIAIVAGLMLAGEWLQNWLFFVVATLWFAAGIATAFLAARRAVRPYAQTPTSVREADLGQRGPLPGGVLGQIGPFAILAAVAAYLAWRWNDLPERFPIHWDLSGSPNGWAVKSLFGVFGTVLIGITACVFSLLIAYGILHGSRPPSVGSATKRMRDLNLIVILGVSYAMAVVTGWAALLPLTGGPGNAIVLILPTTLVLLVVMITKMFQVRRQALAEVASDGRPYGDATPDACWKWGLVYWNAADPALFVEKRFGVGYTLNFAHRGAWLALAGLLAFPLVIAFFGLLVSAGR